MKNIFCFLCFWSAAFASMEYFPGEAAEISDKQEIKLLTWNILGLPNDQVAVRPWEERIDGIAEKILAVDADVVILQECFVRELSLGLQDRLKGRYGHSYLHLDAKPTPLPSGLALFSKLPVSDFRFTPHPDLLDTERNSKMGTLDFVLLDENQVPIAHIAASHFQGSSNCQWRVGLTEGGDRLSYVEVREQEANAALSLSKIEGIPHYLCGDLNVDRRSDEYNSSGLNAAVNSNLTDPMTASMKLVGTNTNFWKHEMGLAKMYPELSQEQVLSLALEYKKLYEEKLKDLLTMDPWNRGVSDFDPSLFAALEKEFDEKMLWDYFKAASLKAIAREKELWQLNLNEGDGPFVSIGRVIEIRAIPIEESLDYVLGLNDLAAVKEIEILQGYDDSSVENTLSDHHPVVATLQVVNSSKS